MEEEEPTNNRDNEAPVAPDNVPSAEPADAVPIAAAAVPSMAQFQLPTTAVDGQGMWRSWTRVFEKPESACLDLLDNCFDAALHPDFAGKVVMDVLVPPEGDDGAAAMPLHLCTGITIMNNSLHEIKSLEEALTVYKSEKNNNSSSTRSNGEGDDDNEDNEEGEQQEQNGDALSPSKKRKKVIGENGVGLKHGCATLSDTSFVLTRNQHTVQLGVIAKSLQSARGVYLPSFTFDMEPQQQTQQQPANDDDDDDDLIDQHIQDMIEIQPRLKDVIAQGLGGGDLPKGIALLAHRIHVMCHDDDWKQQDHVFQLLLCQLHHNNNQGKLIVIDVDAEEEEDPLDSSPAKAFLNEIQTMLPKYYLHIPHTFDFRIDGERTHFVYWQRRLVELTHFPVFVPYDTAIENFPEHSSWVKEGYPLSIYCGLDAQRVQWDAVNSNAISPCMIYIYSRQAGRLIKAEDDARLMLGLTASGSDFMQGLTVIIDDRASQLPLQPTKDGIAWSEQKGGDVHKSNLLAWAGGVAQCFWKEHFKKFDSKEKGARAKEKMKRVVKSFAEDQQEDMWAQEDGRIPWSTDMATADFSRFDNVKWKKDLSKLARKLVIRRVQRNFINHEGNDTLYKINRDRIQKVTRATTAVKRKGSIGATKRATGGRLTQQQQAAMAPGVAAQDDNTDPANGGGVEGKRKRRPTVRYVEYNSDFEQADSDDMISYTRPTRKRKPTKKAAALRRKKAKRGADGDDDDMDNGEAGATAPDTSLLEQKLLETDIQLKQEQLKSMKAERSLQEKNALIETLQAKLQQYQKKPPPQRAPAAATAGVRPEQHPQFTDDYSSLRSELNRVTEERNNYKHRLDARIDQGNKVQELFKQNKLLREQLEEQGGENTSKLLKRVDKLEARIKRRDATIRQLEEERNPSDSASGGFASDGVAAPPPAEVTPTKSSTADAMIQSI